GITDPVEAEMELRNWARESVISKTLLRQEAWKDPEPVPAELIDQYMPKPPSEEVEPEAEPGCETAPSREAAAEPDPEEQKQMRKDIETRLRIERVLAKVGQKLARPKNKEISEFYRAQKAQFETPELIRASHIVKNVAEGEDENAALEAIREVESKLTADNFAQLADEFSDCAGNGGDLGYFPRGQMVEEFENVVFTLEPSQTSGIFRSPFGFHITRVFDKRPGGVRPLTEVRDDIEEVLMRQKQQQAIEDFVDRLLKKAVVETVRRKESSTEAPHAEGVVQGAKAED
ncbi:MAG: peptidylprolyl isomerase, partial [Bryobacteraceae bacterium]